MKARLLRLIRSLAGGVLLSAAFFLAIGIAEKWSG